MNGKKIRACVGSNERGYVPVQVWSLTAVLQIPFSRKGYLWFKRYACSARVESFSTYGTHEVVTSRCLGNSDRISRLGEIARK